MDFDIININSYAILKNRILPPDFMVYKAVSRTIACSDGSADKFYCCSVVDNYGGNKLNIHQWQELHFPDGKIVKPYLSMDIDEKGLFLRRYDSKWKLVPHEESDYLLLNIASPLQKAMYYASISSFDYKSFDGNQLIHHLISVMAKCKTEEEKIIALLHHLPYNLFIKNKEGLMQDFGDILCDKINLIQEYYAHNNNYSYVDSDLIKFRDEYIEYLNKIKNDEALKNVKMADLEEAMVFRKEFNPKFDFDSLEKARFYYSLLIN